jgi:hypothetical protein
MLSCCRQLPHRFVAALRTGALLALCLSAAKVVALSADSSPAGIAYVSGGFGEEELEELRRISPTYNLSLTFATRGGAYVGYVDIRILDAGGAVLVDTQAEGPKFLAGLPPGIYRISATHGQHQVAQTLTLDTGRQRSLTLLFPEPTQTAPAEQ